MIDSEDTELVSQALFVTLTFSMACSFFDGCPKTCLGVKCKIRFARAYLLVLTDTWKPEQSETCLEQIR